MNIFIGYDSTEPVAYHVLAHSILTRASVPVTITPLVLRQLGVAGYHRARGPLESTEFSLTRFLVPHLSGYRGRSVFMDCDMLCRVDIAELMLDIISQANKAIVVCQHDYTPSSTVKFLNQPQTAYYRKNWSSFMVFDNAKCKALTPEYVNTATGLQLHRFEWLAKQDAIGSLSLDWNWLVGEYSRNDEAKVLHFTQGGPWHAGYEDVDYADEWREERGRMLTAQRTIKVSA
jgi:lipopolysaccharide biosynthesis glycosyltransferase